MKKFLQSLFSYSLAAIMTIFLLGAFPVFCILYPETALQTLSGIVILILFVILYLAVKLFGDVINNKLFK